MSPILVYVTGEQVRELEDLAVSIREVWAPCLASPDPTDDVSDGPCFKCQQWQPAIDACEAIVRGYKTTRSGESPSCDRTDRA